MQIYLPVAELSLNVLVLLGMGFAIGVLSGMFGIGGGFILTPLLIFLGVPPGIAVGTGASQVIASSVSSALGHWQRGYIDFQMGYLLIGGGLVGALAGVRVLYLLKQLGQLELFVSLTYVILLGVIGGLMGQAGNGVGFIDLVTAHGVLELSCILVGGAAGLSLGWSIIAPGLRTRRASLQGEAVECLLLVLGTAPWLIVAGIVEGNRANLAEAGLGAVIGTGVGLGLLFWGLVLWRGRVRDEPAISHADTS